MTEQKQIEEMANDLRKSEHWYFDDTDCDFELDRKKTAEALYNAGYRKQCEGEWKKRGNEKTCSLCKFIYYSNNDDWNFCPNCGAKMRGNARTANIMQTTVERLADLDAAAPRKTL